MAALKIWQNINAYDQHVRKILAIVELYDLPFEVWSDLLLYEDENENAQAQAPKKRECLVLHNTQTR